MGRQIKCSFCDNTTTQGINEKSGFSHVKARIGKGVGARHLTLYACSHHSDSIAEELEHFIKEREGSIEVSL